MKQPIALPVFSDNYIWVIVNPTQNTFTCVDPGEAAPVLSYAVETGHTLSCILLTHHHHDHIGGVPDLLKVFPNAVVYAPHDQRIPSPITPVDADDIVPIEPYAFEVLSTPGHTSTHVCYYEPRMHWLFCGDTLFSAGCGRVFDGTMQALHDSLLTLRNLPDETQIYCGHEYTRKNLRFASTIEPQNQTISTYATALIDNSTELSLPSTIATEKKINPFLRTDTLSLQKYAKRNNIDPLDSLAIFKHLRNKKDLFS